MPSPLSDASSSRNTLDDGNQSTKDRRRERNRLAAQKHRLRRNERMNQLEQQVLALQQEKSILLARIDEANGGPGLHGTASKAPPTPPASADSSAHSEDADDDDDEEDDDDLPLLSPRSNKRQRLSIEPPLSILHAHSPSPSPSQIAPPLHTPLPPIDDALAHHAHHAAYIGRLEDRIVELERWTEDLNGELADALDSHARNAEDLHHRVRRAQDQLAHAEHQRAHALREADALRLALDARAEDERHAQQVSQKLREELEGTEVTLDLQRVENDRLRDRLARLDDEAAREEKRLFRELRDARASLSRFEEENGHLHELLREKERARSVDSVGYPGQPSRKRKHEETQTETLLASQSRQLQLAKAEAEERENERRRLSERVCYLQNALGKAGAFLTSKGIPLEFLHDSDDE